MNGRAAAIGAVLGATIACAWPAGAAAQERELFSNQLRQYEQRVREMLAYVPPPERRVDVDWGGWFNLAGARFEATNDDREHNVSRSDLFLWGRLAVDQAHEIYARGRLSYLDISDAHVFDEGWETRLDRLFYLFDLRQATLRKEKRVLPYNLRTQVGRQYVEYGTGLVLSTPMDAVQVAGEYANVEVAGLIGKSIDWIPNIDRSFPVADRNDRCFYGVQTTYKGLRGRHEPFAFFLWQQDDTNPSPRDPCQKFDYDSQYLGLGSRGRAFVRNLFYQTELAFEQGHSFGRGATSDPDPIEAAAYDLFLRYLFDGACEPSLIFEYLWASGDDDRICSPTNTYGGNKAGTTDHGFNAFGYRNTGIALAPYISNLHMLRLGGTILPAPRVRNLRQFQVGADFFAYMKDESAAAGPDPTSVNDDPNIGQEIDLYFNWRLTNDLFWTVRYGSFFPGSAYEGTRSARNVLFSGVTISF